MLAGCDGMTEIPLARWDHGAYFDPEPGSFGKAYVKHAAFIEGVEFFDARRFGISSAEA
jgi:acyl transferase domain-containing protein